MSKLITNKKLLLISLINITLILTLATTALAATTFYDDFNDGNANGWDLSQTIHPLNNIGNWRVENGKLVQDTGFDGVLALINNPQFSTQVTETELKLNGPSGGIGIVFWFKDKQNFAKVGVSNGQIEVVQRFDNVETKFIHAFNFNINEDRWVKLRIEADSTNGEIKVFADNNYMFTETLTTTVRTGQTGIMEGNAGGLIDFFKITSPTPLNKDQCKNNGWKSFNPIFKNQGECISYSQNGKSL